MDALNERNGTETSRGAFEPAHGDSEYGSYGPQEKQDRQKMSEIKSESQETPQLGSYKRKVAQLEGKPKRRRFLDDSGHSQQHENTPPKQQALKFPAFFADSNPVFGLPEITSFNFLPFGIRDLDSIRSSCSEDVRNKSEKIDSSEISDLFLCDNRLTAKVQQFKAEDEQVHDHQAKQYFSEPEYNILEATCSCSNTNLNTNTNTNNNTTKTVTNNNIKFCEHQLQALSIFLHQCPHIPSLRQIHTKLLSLSPQEHIGLILDIIQKNPYVVQDTLNFIKIHVIRKSRK